MKIKIFFVALALLMILVMPSVPVIPRTNAQISPGPQVNFATFSYFGYFPATLDISFPHTTEINSNVSSLNGGLFTYTGETGYPQSTIKYQMNDSDQYTIIFQANYPVPISGNLSWILFSPGFSPAISSTSFQNSTSVEITFVVVLQKQQVIPSAEEIANETAGLMVSKYNVLIADQQAYMNSQLSNLQDQIYVLLGVVVFVNVVVVVIALVYIRRQQDR